MSRKEEEADKLVKKATKLEAPSLLSMRIKPDWESSAPLYSLAAGLYRQLGNLEKAVAAYEGAAAANAHLGMTWHAAKELEAAGDFCQLKKQVQLATKCYRRAAELFLKGGRHTTGADCLAKGAKALEGHDLEKALVMAEEALEIYTSEDKGQDALDAYRLAIGICIQMERYQQSAELLMSMAGVCGKGPARSSHCMAYLGAIVTCLYAGDGETAWKNFQQAMTSGLFACSEEGSTAQTIVDAYRSGDEEQVRKVISKNQCIKFLDNKVARLAVRLPHASVKEVAAGLNTAAGGEPVAAVADLFKGSGQSSSYQGSKLQYGPAGSGAGGGGGRGGGGGGDQEDEDEELL